MPTGEEKGEYQALKNATYWKWEDGGYYVYDQVDGDEGGLNGSATGTYDKADALLFFPAAGCGKDNPRINQSSSKEMYRSNVLADL